MASFEEWTYDSFAERLNIDPADAARQVDQLVDEVNTACVGLGKPKPFRRYERNGVRYVAADADFMAVMRSTQPEA